MYAKVVTVEQQLEIMSHVAGIVTKEPVRLIVIDSVMALFRCDVRIDQCLCLTPCSGFFLALFSSPLTLSVFYMANTRSTPAEASWLRGSRRSARI